MKTKKLYFALMLSMAVCPIALAQKPADDIPKSTKVGVDTPAAPGSNATPGGASTTESGRKISQSGGPDGKKTSEGKGTVADLVMDSPSHSTLVKALKATGLDATLASKDGSYTVFAPTDAAFDKLPAGTLGELMMPANKEKLKAILLYHVVSGKMAAADLKSGDVKTLNGAMLDVKVGSGMVKVDKTPVDKADMMAGNGVVHSIGTVLMPKE